RPARRIPLDVMMLVEAPPNAVDPPVAERTVERLAQRDRGVRRALLGDLHPYFRRAIVIGRQPRLPLRHVGAGDHGVVHVISRSVGSFGTHPPPISAQQLSTYFEACDRSS